MLTKKLILPQKYILGLINLNLFFYTHQSVLASLQYILHGKDSVDSIVSQQDTSGVHLENPTHGSYINTVQYL